MTRIRRDRVAGRTLAELIFGIILISGVFALIGTIALPGRWYFLGGVVAGAVAAILLVINMYDSIEAALSMVEKRARSYASMHAVLRIVITGVLLAVGFWIDVYTFVGIALGVVSLKLSGLLHIPIASLFRRMMGEPPEPKTEIAAAGGDGTAGTVAEDEDGLPGIISAGRGRITGIAAAHEGGTTGIAAAHESGTTGRFVAGKGGTTGAVAEDEDGSAETVSIAAEDRMSQADAAENDE